MAKVNCEKCGLSGPDKSQKEADALKKIHDKMQHGNLQRHGS